MRGTLLIAGTSVGGGMLALPVLTSLGGFVPSLVIYLLCWLFMASTGLLFLEISLWMGKESNIVSMAEQTLGFPGKMVAWIVYLFLFYCLTVAYIVGCGDLVVNLFSNSLSEWMGSLLFVACFAPIVFNGAHLVSKVNSYLMLGLAIFFCAFVIIGAPFVNPQNLKEHSWTLALMGLPVSFTAFAYQGIIPTLTHYLSFDIKKIRLSILFGSAIPFIAYIIWQWLILGIVPTYGPGGLVEALEKGDTAVQPLKYFIDHSSVYLVGQCFAFFALVTSFFGVTLGLLDFLADGLKIEKTSGGKLALSLLIFIPPLLIAFTFPHIFLIALSYAGGFGCAILLGLLPIVMVWSGRYHLGLKGPYTLMGGKFLLSLLFLFVVFEIFVELALTFQKLIS
ncbi:aromatic amino acid transport family protein [Parachlamydia sp. AcF125]|uniref:amino acid permease n=1 Tax=Parachlamydia sp. AcF125 TaxID=2795736 RepID=UPI0020163381|nr:aromatic amino acid transport family protein [Parachlamydia sp. AcF125]